MARYAPLELPTSALDALPLTTVCFQPHSHHYQQVHAALTAGKNVLCEKSFTANADQAKALVKLAQEKDLFLMEAVWLRFQPFSYKLQEILRSGVIGNIRGVQAELNIDFTEKAKADPKHRLVNPDLAGGSLLDLGPCELSRLTFGRASSDFDSQTLGLSSFSLSCPSLRPARLTLCPGSPLR